VVVPALVEPVEPLVPLPLLVAPDEVAVPAVVPELVAPLVPVLVPTAGLLLQPHTMATAATNANAPRLRANPIILPDLLACTLSRIEQSNGQTANG
jgi:hypothetical protein